MIGIFIGRSFASARDLLARRLVKSGIHPDTLTIVGTALTMLGGVCYAVGAGSRFAWSLAPSSSANAYLLCAGGLLVLASACDMLDGAVARIGKRNTRFGAFLDSTLDRLSDFAVYAGIAVHYAWTQPANVTLVLGAMLALFNSFMISYTRARAEDLIDSCTAGYWQRGERSAAILISTFAYNIPALVIQQAILPALTVVRRISYTRAVLAGDKPIADPRDGNFWLKIRLWRWPRGTWAYDLVTGLNIAWLVFARFGRVDVLRKIF